MARPRSIDDETILAAAREVLLRDGMNAPTSAIARAAGVSEGTLFKRFGTKHGLLHRALALPDPTWLEHLGERVGQGELKDQLEWLYLRFIAYFREKLPPMMHLMMHGAFTPEQMFDADPAHSPAATVKRVTNYLDAERRLGRMRHCDPELLARTLVSGAHHYVFFEITKQHPSLPMAAETCARGIVDLLWSGVRPVDGREPVRDTNGETS